MWLTAAVVCKSEPALRRYASKNILLLLLLACFCSFYSFYFYNSFDERDAARGAAPADPAWASYVVSNQRQPQCNLVSVLRACIACLSGLLREVFTQDKNA